MIFQAGDPVTYLRSKPGSKVIEQIPARYVHPHGGNRPYGWRRHLILAGDQRLYVNMTSLVAGHPTSSSQPEKP